MALADLISYTRQVTVRPKIGSSDVEVDGGIRYSRLISLVLQSGILVTTGTIIELVLFYQWNTYGDGLTARNAALYVILEPTPQVTVSVSKTGVTTVYVY